MVSEILSCEAEKLEYEIVFRGKVGDAERSACNPSEAVGQKDTLAKTLYNNLFSWLVTRMNSIILTDPSLLAKERTEIKTVGLLDIFGFECFAINDYEQLLINYANEKLQKLYLTAVFEAEKITFKEEGLGDVVDNLTYTDKTTPVIEMLDNRLSGKPQGILNKVDDYKRSEETKNLRSMIAKDFAANPNYVKHKDQDKFQIRHTAKLVLYISNEFIVKNLDKLSDDLKSMMYNRMDPVICGILKSEESANLGNTIWKKFSIQIKDLMDELGESHLLGIKDKKDASEPCDLHFIRCLKPNESTHKNMFVYSLVLMQITYMGILDTIKVRKANYPHRIPYIRFYERYEDLCSTSLSTPFRFLSKTNPNYTELSKQLLKEQFGDLAQGQYLLGKTRIFIKNNIMGLLEKARSRAQTVKNQAAEFIQDTYHAYKARMIHNPKMKIIGRLYKYYKKRFKKNFARKALRMALRLEKSFINYKTEKLKEIEEGVSIKVAALAKTVSIKLIMRKGIKARELMGKSLIKAMGKHKVHKAVVVINVVLGIFDKSWKVITKNTMNNISKVLVRYSRSFATRKLFERQLELAKEKAAFIKTTGASLLIQRLLKGKDVRVKMGLAKKAASKIQGWIKSIWLRSMIQQIKRAIIIIQRQYRAHYERANEANKQKKKYAERQSIFMSNLRQLENNLLLERAHEEPDERLKNISLKLYSAILQSKTTRDDNKVIKRLKESQLSQKISTFTIILDVHVLVDTTYIYPDSWARSWLSFSTEMLSNDISPLGLEVGLSHTLAVNSKNQLFTWGISEFKAVPGVTEVRFKQIACGDIHSLGLDYDGNLFVWGRNKQGQLGTGNYESIKQPYKMTNCAFSGEVKEIAAKGNLSFVVSNEGKAYMWPIKNAAQEFILTPIELPFTKLAQIDVVSCGTDFVVLLSTQGLLFSFGRAAELGQLGHGDKCEKGIPQVIESLKSAGERIQAITCGHAHCIAKTALGKLYAWGWGALGQLGLGTLVESEVSPKQLTLYKETPNSKDLEITRKKALSVVAGYSHTVILTEGRIPYYCGTCGTIEKQPTPIRLLIEKSYPELFPKGIQPTGGLPSFSIGKIGIAWSKSLSVTYATMLNMRGLSSTGNEGKANTPSASIGQQLNGLSMKWNSKDIDPPYIEALASVFSASVMRKQTASIKKRPVQKTKVNINYINSIKAALKKGMNYEGLVAEKGLEAKVKETDKWLQKILDKDQEARTEQENSTLSALINKVLK